MQLDINLQLVKIEIEIEFFCLSVIIQLRGVLYGRINNKI